MAARRARGFSVVVALFVLSVGAAAALLAVLAAPTPDGHEPAPPEYAAPDDPPGGTGTGVAEAVGPRRLGVAGRPGHAVVMLPDGSSYLETPDGTRTQLTGPQQAEADAEAAARRVEAARGPRRPGQLVVTETGVVDVPADAVITLIGRDKVVTHEPDGTSKVYFCDGRVVSQARGERADRAP